MLLCLVLFTHQLIVPTAGNVTSPQIISNFIKAMAE